jgi:hypothetical protein
VVWNRLSLSPPAASRSATGVLHGPPNADEAPKPTSSSSTISTFGAPSGGRSGAGGRPAMHSQRRIVGWDRKVPARSSNRCVGLVGKSPLGHPCHGPACRFGGG